MKSYAFLASVFGVTVLAGLMLSAPVTRADEAHVSTATIMVPVACSMIGNTSAAHVAEIPAGIDSRGSGYYPDGIGLTTLKAYCNDDNGFSIYAVGYSDDTIGNTYLRDNTLGQTDDILTGTTFSGGTSNWAMKIGVTSGTYTPIIAGSTGDSEKQAGDVDYSNWAAVPSEYARVAYRNSGTDVNNDNIASAEGASVTTTYAAYISPVQKSGTYVGKVKYTLVHPASGTPAQQPQPAVAGYIVYHPNGSSVEGTMANQSAGNNASVTLYPSNFSRTGYGFAGWSTTYDYSDSTGFYGPNETITTPADTSTNGLSLYAIWVKSAGNIQGWSGCSSLTSGAVTALTDQRDSNTYAVAKLKDGNCWMIENLRLNNTASNNSDGTLAQGYGTSATYGNFSGLADPESPWANNITTANSLYYSGTQDGTASINIGTSNNPGYRFPRYNNQNTASRGGNTTNNTNIYSYGNYYTWHAAIADLTYNGTNNSSVTNTSLCPAGWHLPTGGGAYASDGTTGVNITGNTSTYREFYNLGYKIMDEVKTAYEDTPNEFQSRYSSATTNNAGDTATEAFRKYPNNFVYSGSVRDSSVNGRGSYGGYWSSTAYSSNGAYTLTLNSSNVYPGTLYYGKYIGRSIRCLVSSGS